MSASARSLGELGLTGFCGGLPQPARQASHIDSLLRTGLTRPEWCWAVIDEMGRAIVHQLWWSPVPADKPVGVDLLTVTDPQAALELLVWGRDNLAPHYAVCQLFAPVTADAGASAARPTEVAVLQAAGFAFTVGRVNLEWTRAAGIPSGTGRLSFRRADRVDEVTLLMLFASVAEGSLDQGMQVERARLGPQREAELRLARALGQLAGTGGFRIGLDALNIPVGYVVPARAGEVAMIAEVGVAAHQRGQRYVDDLLAEGTRVLVETGANRIIADVDLANTPMRAAFARAGYREILFRDDYHWGTPPG